MLTDAELDELERLEASMTPGPWCVHPNGSSIWTGEEWAADGDECCHLFNVMPFNFGHQSTDDAHAVTEFRNAAPTLLADLRSARATIAEMRGRLERALGSMDAVLHGAEVTGGRTEGEP